MNVVNNTNNLVTFPEIICFLAPFPIPLYFLQHLCQGIQSSKKIQIIWKPCKRNIVLASYRLKYGICKNIWLYVFGNIRKVYCTLECKHWIESKIHLIGTRLILWACGICLASILCPIQLLCCSVSTLHMHSRPCQYIKKWNLIYKKYIFWCQYIKQIKFCKKNI